MTEAESRKTIGEAKMSDDMIAAEELEQVFQTPLDSVEDDNMEGVQPHRGKSRARIGANVTFSCDNTGNGNTA